jgi:hypothetical protein
MNEKVKNELDEIHRSFEDIIYVDKLEKYLITRLGAPLLTSFLNPRLDEVKAAGPHCRKLIEVYEDIAKEHGINLPLRYFELLDHENMK